MSGNIAPEEELLKSFVKNSLEKLNELRGISNVLILEGARPELFEAIFRCSLTIKNFARTFNLIEISDFLTNPIDAQFQKIRHEDSKVASEQQKQEIRSNISILKKMIEDLVKNNDKTNDYSTKVTKNECIKLMEPDVKLLNAIGQLSIWGFHDIMNSLAKIDGFAEIINNSLDKISPSEHNYVNEVKENLNKIIENSSLITNSINQVRALRGKTTLQIKEYNLSELINVLHNQTAQPKKISECSFFSLPNVTLKCDKIIFSQLWSCVWKILQEWELADSAHLNSCLTARIRKNEDQTNEGLPNFIDFYLWYEAQKDQKFLPESLDFSEQTPFPDLANVLFFSKKLAEKNNMTIHSSLTPSGHALFKVSIPCSEVKSSLVCPKKAHSIMSSLNQENIKKEQSSQNVLVVDDEKDLRTILTMKINKMGYVTYTASNTAEAVQILREKNIKLVISDLFLEGESGLEILKSITELESNIPFVFITGADEDDVSSAIFEVLSKFAKAFLTKPVSTQILKETIEKHILK